MKKFFGLLALTIAFTISVNANVPPPTPEKSKDKTTDGQMTIRLDKNATEAKLVIPKSKLKQLRAELEELENDSDNTASLTNESGNSSRTQTIVGGLFLSLAFVFGGFWFVRNRKTSEKLNKTVAGAVVLTVVSSAATIVFANIAPPLKLRTISSELFNKETFGGFNRADGNIKIQISATAENIELIVPDPEKPANAK